MAASVGGGVTKIIRIGGLTLGVIIARRIAIIGSCFGRRLAKGRSGIVLEATGAGGRVTKIVIVYSFTLSGGGALSVTVIDNSLESLLTDG